MLVEISLEMLTIVILVGVIIGMVAGITLVRPVGR